MYQVLKGQVSWILMTPQGQLSTSDRDFPGQLREPVQGRGSRMSQTDGYPL